MNIKSILFPTDFSHYNEAALRLASTLAAEARAKLYILHVHDSRELNALAGEGSYLYASTIWEKEQREAEEQLREIVPLLATVAYEHVFLTGNPVQEILEFAETNGIELIVMASHGRTGLPRLLMGSIAEGIMRKATCPVLIVKQPPGDEEPVATVAFSGTTVSEGTGVSP
jgi:nucleotide-binding universal stress UspA family protein